jgi:hypothetical protein
MKQTAIFLFFISSFLLGNLAVFAQNSANLQDTTAYREKYGIRVGIDISKPLRTILEEDYRGLEILGDYRVYKDYYVAIELGNESLPFKGDNISVISSGSYAKLGVDYNAYDNWDGMQNMIFAGLRYGFATFSQEVTDYQVYTTSQFFGSEVREGFESSGLNANWVELMVGIKVELLNNLFLSANVQLKRMLFQTSPDGLDNLTVPGFNRTNDFSSFGVGYGYSISYMIPFYKKAKSQD